MYCASYNFLQQETSGVFHCYESSQFSQKALLCGRQDLCLKVSS